MSRNLGRASCVIAGCRGQVIDQELPRLIYPSDCGAYFTEYDGMVVAEATCDMCQTDYLRWYVIRPTERPPLRLDLSFRASFDDEPSPRDLHPKRARRAGAPASVIAELRRLKKVYGCKL